MSSFETRLIKYAYDPQRNQITEIANRLIERKIDPLSEVREWEIGLRLAVTFNERTGDYVVKDANNCISFTARTLAEAEKRIATEVAGMNWGEALRAEFGEIQEMRDAMSNMQSEAARIAVAKLRLAWGNCETL